MSATFRHSAGFGKRIEFWVIGLMLKEGMDVYVPLVDDHAVDAIVKRKDGSIAQIQIKARSNDVKFGDAGLFAAIPHELRENYWFVFYSERMSTFWIMTSDEFVAQASRNKNGKNAGKRTIWFNGVKGTKEYTRDRYQQFVAADFSRISALPPKLTTPVNAA
jgi:hypothetical protein